MAVADAHIEGARPSENFGTNHVLSLAQSTLGGDKAYLLFDASGWGETNLTRIESLRVVWAGSTNITRTLAASLITGSSANDWSETTITWNNAPGNNVLSTDRNFVAFPGQTVTTLGSVQYASGNPRELIIPFGAGSAQENALLTALNTGDRKATIGVNYNSSQTTAVFIYSREHEGGIHAAAIEVSGLVPVPPLSDGAFFARLNLDHPGLEAVRSAVMANNLPLARTELARYYRQRTGVFHYVDAQDPAASVANPASSLQSARPLVERTGSFDAQYWVGDVFDWDRADIRYKERMYFFSNFGEAAAVEQGDEVARALVNLVRSFAYQYRSPASPSGGMWATMNVGIRMRTGWPTAFQCLLQSPAFTDDDIVLFLKTVWDQTDYIYRNPSETSNWLTFEMAGLYTSGVVYPEFRDAVQWRRLACQTALNDIDRGWLPDGMSIEKSASYGTFFSNYFFIYDLAQFVGRLSEFNLDQFPVRTERLYEAYLKLMSPDRLTPCINDGSQVDVPGILASALTHFPHREDFRWIATRGKAGVQPAVTSLTFPFAGYVVLRSGWETNANYLFCDAGPVGYRHAHQDKLQVVMWSYGRQILMDSPQAPETGDWTYPNYFRDTFSHSTGLVDNRPQRRRWYNAPHPRDMPYQPLEDFHAEIREGGAWAAGSYTGSYGKAGSIGNDSYPYKVPSNFYESWGTPASHHRQIAYAAPDIFIVQDWLVPNDAAAHTYEIRWQLDSTAVTVAGARAQTTDNNLANLAIIPIQSDGLQVVAVSAQSSPEIMGWKVLNGQIRSATTVRHIRAGTGPRSFLTLLYPLRKGASAGGVAFEHQDGVVSLHTGDGRVYSIRPAAQPGGRLIIDNAAFFDTDGDGIPDWWEMKYFGGPTAAQASALSANGKNTIHEAYLAGLDPANPAARFEILCRLKDGQTVLSWDPVLPDRIYTILSSTNLLEGFGVQTTLSWPTNTFTFAPANKAGFFRVQVRRAP
jgi:hypothetical protein